MANIQHLKVITPAIKSQGIKTKLVPWINKVIACSSIDLKTAKWVEPFFGTGVVGLNAPVQGAHIIGDSNPHIIAFYNAIKDGAITETNIRQYLEHEGELLLNAADNGYEHYREVKKRFNAEHSPFDFVFLSRAGFNGMMRFNSKGEWNIPFCKKPNRFAPAYVTKICNQVAATAQIIKNGDWAFLNQNFADTISTAKQGDIIYCDPPYFGRNTDYYNGWTENDEKELYRLLKNTKAHFILSTWHHNEFRENEMINRFWNEFNILTQEHHYYNGSHTENRHPVVEALVCNFNVTNYDKTFSLK